MIFIIQKYFSSKFKFMTNGKQKFHHAYHTS